MRFATGTAGVKWNPGDASSISVWNRGGEPNPYWVTMPNADPDFMKGLSFWHHDRIGAVALSTVRSDPIFRGAA
jgi:hypothetical protein